MTEREMRAYLLGQAAEPEAEQLEARLLEDADVHDALRGVEDDLFDDYARGVLTGEEGRRFLERYGEDRARHLFARALMARATTPPAAARSIGWRWMPAAAAAAVVAGTGLALLTRSVPRDVPSVPPQSQPSVQSLPSPTVLTVTLGTSRSGTAAREASLPGTSPALELRVRLNPADRYDSYSMELRTALGASVWRGDKLEGGVVKGELWVVGSVPAALVPAGSYELSVKGVGPQSREEVLGYAPLSIRR